MTTPAEERLGRPVPEHPAAGSVPSPPSGTRPARVLIADDDPGIRDLIAAVAENLGLEVVTVADAEAALATMKAQLPDLVLSDLRMPGLGGAELCRRLKADPASRHIPVVLVTGIEAQHRRVATEAGADDILIKPFSLPELETRILTLLRSRG
jgi:CheY-like chemotaxis protein